MKNKYLCLICAIVVFFPIFGKTIEVNIIPMPNDSQQVVAPEIYGQFAEHLGRCIYGGIWVGEDSDIPNTKGYRNDVIEAFRELQIPVLRWPGGCFADEYHWVDGIGPKENRPKMINSNWGGTVEDNSFGTHEFFDFCELLGIEPYLSLNVGSGTVEEMAKWIEYITAVDGPQAKIRKENGREKPWKLKYVGIGNESWGCGGNFTPEEYSNVYRRYQTYARDFDGNKLYKIASGASDYDFNWTDVLMKNAKNYMKGLSLHYYSVWNWDDKGSATDFSPELYYYTLGKALEIDSVINHHVQIMDKYDPDKKVDMILDEWGTWWNVEPGTNPGHLYQQNTMRDAMVAALSFNTFHKHADRLKMTNIAQIANVLQSMVLTNGDKIVLTPTYYIFKMYVPHQGGTYIPLDIQTPLKKVPSERKDFERQVPIVSATATEKDGVVTLSFANTSLEDKVKVLIPLESLKVGKIKEGEILKGENISDFNDFDMPEKVNLQPFKDSHIKNGILELELPEASIVTLRLV
ncbi:MAG: alpha-N-arabinofuranosidase [Muribaculaceae bacterium]|nr:alpha-N-arabinofuranosidase [Muribaculaceae bacterium]